MTEILNITMHADKPRLKKKVVAQVRGCGSPHDWTIREPISTNKVVWLSKEAVDKKHGKLILVKRLLYYWEYKDAPLKQIRMVCGDKNCVNPAHMRIRGWESEADDKIASQIARGWLYPDDAEQWFGWENIHNISIPPDFKVDNHLDSIGD